MLVICARLVLVAAFTTVFAITAFAEPITGPVSHIRDGDTFEIGTQAIRLCGIDALERHEVGGRESTEFLRQLIRGETLRCIPVTEGSVCDGRSGKFTRDRIAAQCFIDGIRDIAEIMVRAGHACDWPKFSGGHYRVVGGCSR